MNGRGLLFPKISCLTLLVSGLCLTSGVLAADEIRFSRHVLPLLADRCFHCHGPDENNRQADLRLDERTAAVDSGVINPHDAASSELMVRILSDDPDLQMPPADSHRKAFSPTEIDTLRRWIDQGAPWGQHWSLEKPIRPVVPETPWTTRNAIDAFVQKQLQANELQPSAEADKRTLIRRLTLDLIGLPPTIDEVNAFLTDGSPEAYERLVDRLLASKHYGERMAWPWLDAARYADTSGYQGDPERTMWPWRDWVVNSMNDNMPFDQFTVEQLAGDLLLDATPEQILATAFNRNHMHNSEGGRISEETRVENVFDRTETTATVWLGLTMQCARCHDHKFDSLSNEEYFRFYDFFNQTTESGKGDRGAAAPPSMQYGPDKVPVMIMDTSAERRTTNVLLKGIYNSVTDKTVTAAVPQAILPAVPIHEDQPLNRLDLAQWIVSPENPLMARVTVNRYWQTFFGRGLVTTPDDFGVQGSQPSHPDLLDWLAVEFVESGWNVKHIHKLIVMSHTYRQSSSVPLELADKDPENIWLGRISRFRMPSWMIRDHALATCGLLNETFGGPAVKPYQPAGIWAEATFGQKKYEADNGDKLYRRSLYTFWRRIVGPTIFFDSAKRQTCEVKPNRTNTPLHALTTLNDVTFVEAARMLAQHLLQQPATHSQRIEIAFERLTSRPPTATEATLLQDRLADYTAHFQANQTAAAELLATGEAPRDDSISTPELAAYTTLINTLMNLDEVLVKP